MLSTASVWCAFTGCEERLANGTSIARKKFDRGEQVNNISRFFVADHSTSIAALTDSIGSLVMRHEFDPWGRRTATGDVDQRASGFTQHQWQATGNVWLTLYRAYDPELARWLSEDPIGFEGGFNLYSYVFNGPVNWRDPLGLMVYRCCRTVVLEANGGFSGLLQRTADTFNLKHCYVKTDTKAGGMGPAGGGPLPPNPIGKPTTINDHSREGSEGCTPVPEASEECVNRRLVFGQSTGNWWPWNNCNTLTTDIIRGCSPLAKNPRHK